MNHEMIFNVENGGFDENLNHRIIEINDDDRNNNDNEQSVNYLEEKEDDKKEEEEEGEELDITTDYEYFDVIKDGGIKKRIIQEGKGEEHPPTDALCVIHYIGRRKNGDIIDNNFSKKTKNFFQFNIGRGEILSGLDGGIQSMKKNESAEFILRPEYAYGKMGCPPRIPANCEVVYEVYLKDFVEMPDDDKSVRSLIKKAEILKYEGNQLFKRNAFRKASKCYNRALDLFKKKSDLLNITPKESYDIKQIKLVLYNNIAACFLNLDQHKKSVISCKLALEIDKDNLKANYRLIQNYLATNDIEKAEELLKYALKLYPKNKSLKKEYRYCIKRIKEEEEKEKKRYKYLFTDKKKRPKSNNNNDNNNSTTNNDNNNDSSKLN